MLIKALPPDDRQEAALSLLGRHVGIVTEQHGNRSNFTGWVSAVPNLRSGTTGHVLVLRPDPARPDKDLAFSLAQVVSMQEVPR